MANTSSAIRSLRHVASTPSPRSISTSDHYKLVQQSRAVPRTSNTRLRRSLTEQPIDLTRSGRDGIPDQGTYLYLAYGSNMAALTFLDRRKIKPISQVNVVCPQIRLTFDLAGLPYQEPCFANVEFCDTTGWKTASQEVDDLDTGEPQYHKDRWYKGLVAVVYEVTAEDFAHILATEGGGAAYHWQLVDCYSLSSDPSQPVPTDPQNLLCKTYTLYSGTRQFRRDPAYAQPSARYMKLLTDGAAEHNLPNEYREYLAQIRPYVTSTKAQTVGGALLQATWGPILLFFFKGNGSIFSDSEGKYPDWYIKMANTLFGGIWKSYDTWFEPQFGDGERSIENGGVSPPGKQRTKKKKFWRGKSDLDEKRMLSR